MELTKDNFYLYAAQHYDNPTCISEEEFKFDIKQLRQVKRMMTRYINGEESNIRLLINNVMIFYNCFEHHAATNMIQYSVDNGHIRHFNSMLKFLSFPLLEPELLDSVLYHKLKEEFS